MTERTADEAHHVHENDLRDWLITLRDHPLEAIRMPDNILRLCRDMGLVSGMTVTSEGLECLSQNLV